MNCKMEKQGWFQIFAWRLKLPWRKKKPRRSWDQCKPEHHTGFSEHRWQSMNWQCHHCLLPLEIGFCLKWCLFSLLQPSFSTFLCILWTFLIDPAEIKLTDFWPKNENQVKKWTIHYLKYKLYVKGNLYTASLGVIGSYPEPLEAKLTPVSRSLSWRAGLEYGGSSSLIPNSSAEDKK